MLRSHIGGLFWLNSHLFFKLIPLKLILPKLIASKLNTFFATLSTLSAFQKYLLAITLLLKLCLAVVVPVTGDEAYFLQWGQHLAWGYYDHPPTTGWIAWLLSLGSDHIAIYRIFSAFANVIVAWLIYCLAINIVPTKSALLVSLAYLLSPISLVYTLYLNDVVLVLFGMAGFTAYWFAQEKNSLPYALLSGLMFAFAFLSKYFSVLLFFGIGLHALLSYRNVHWRVIIVVSIMVILGAGEHLYYNITNCWDTLMFNAQTRASDESVTWQNVVLFFVSLVLLISPIALWKPAALLSTKKLGRYSLISVIFTSFMVLLFVVSWAKLIGIHWFALAMPFGFLYAAKSGQAALNGLFNYAAITTTTLILAALTILIGFTINPVMAPTKSLQENLNFDIYAQEACEYFPAQTKIFTKGYSTSAILAYHCQDNDFGMAFSYSEYGREYDKWSDLKTYHDKTMVLFVWDKADIDRFSEYFVDYSLAPVRINGVGGFYVFTGNKFNYEKYRQDYLVAVNKMFYQTESTLPMCECNFQTKYNLTPQH